MDARISVRKNAMRMTFFYVRGETHRVTPLRLSCPLKLRSRGDQLSFEFETTSASIGAPPSGTLLIDQVPSSQGSKSTANF